MARPVKTWPKKNVVTFRLSDPEYAVLRFYAQHVSGDFETFSDTLGRMLRDFILDCAAKQLETLKKFQNPPKVSLTKDKPEERRARYAAEIKKAGKRVKKAVEEGLAKPEQDFPTLVDIVLDDMFPGRLASPSVDASLASGAAHTPNAGAGESTAKIQNFASPAGSAAQRAAESAGKSERFSEDLGNSGFLPGDGLDKPA